MGILGLILLFAIPLAIGLIGYWLGRDSRPGFDHRELRETGPANVHPTMKSDPQ